MTLRSLVRRSGLRSLAVPLVAIALRELGSANLRRDLLKLVGRDAGTIVDVGAHFGESSALFSEIFPEAAISAFEPDPVSYRVLVSRHLSRVRAFNVALGSADGSRVLNLNADSGTNSFFPANSMGLRYLAQKMAVRSSVEVPIRTLDDFREELGLSTIDLLKVDVQGYELEVLRGATRSLKDVRALQIECNFIPQYKGSSTFSDVDLFLREQGFALHNLYDLYRESDDGILIFGDGIFLRTSAPA